MNYSDLLKKRQSVRDFENKKIGLPIIEEILNEACLAPSAKNLQPWRFIIIENENMLRKLSDESKKNMLDDIENPGSLFTSFERTLKDPDYNVFYNAPSLVIIGGSKNSPYLVEDCSLFAAHFMLSAAERELGTCWIGLGKFIKDKNLRKEIGMPDDFEIVAPIIIGYPSSKESKRHSRNRPVILKKIL